MRRLIANIILGVTFVFFAILLVLVYQTSEELSGTSSDGMILGMFSVLSDVISEIIMGILTSILVIIGLVLVIFNLQKK